MEYLLSKVVDPFLSKLVDYALGETETSVFKSLENHLKLLSAHEYDIVDQIRKTELLGFKKRKKTVQCWLEQVESIVNEVGPLINEMKTRGFVRKFFSEGRAANLDARVSELVEQRPAFGELVVDDHKVQGSEFFTRRLVGERYKENLERIWTLLVTEKSPCIGIHGMGGVGKTTLAKHINNRLVKESSYRVVWITVSQEYSVRMLQDEIAKNLQFNISNLLDVDKRSSALHKALSKLNNVVLIFDDVWEQFDLMKIGHPLSINGCRLVITTRERQVCHQIGCREVIEVMTLQEHEAWTLFKEIHGPELNLTPEVESIIKSTIQMCKGLPLGIITLAGSMRSETAKHAWSEVLAQFGESVMGQHDMDKDVFKVLKHSFDRLGAKDGKGNGHSKSQKCFLYCSTYPEDYEIPREELIRRLIVEGYLDRKTRKACFDQGHTILDNLIYACLLEKGCDGGVKMHDLLRAMALRLIKVNKLMVFDGQKSSLEEIPKEELWTKEIEKIFLWHVKRKSLSNLAIPDCPMLSTLVLNFPLKSRFSSRPLSALPDLFFSQMRGLHTLDMSLSDFERLPDSLSDIVSLKALLLTGCRYLRYVPNLGKLKNLEELDLSRTCLEEAPQGLEELTNLKFLSFRGALRLKETSMELNFTKLQCFLLPPQINLQVAAALKSLEGFHGRLKDVSYLLRLIRSNPKLKYKVGVQPQYPTTRSGVDVYAINWDNEECGLWLDLFEFKFEEARYEDLALLSKAIMVALSLDGCKWRQSNCIIDDVSRMCNPTSLRRLQVINDERVECLWRREEFLQASTSVHLPLAQHVFVSLGKLEIVKCNKVKMLGLLPSQFPNLEDLRIEDCSQIEEIVEGVEGNATFDKLVALCLKYLPRMKSICHATMVCPSIREINLIACKRLKRLGLVPSHSPNLLVLKIVDCLEIEEIMEVGEDRGVNVVFLHKLQTLCLINLPRLKSICNATMACPSIQGIVLYDCMELKKFALIFGRSDNFPPPHDLGIILKEGSEEWWEALELEQPTYRPLLKPAFWSYSYFSHVHT